MRWFRSALCSACVLAAVASCCSGFTGVQRARIDFTGGMPRLMINDKPALPIVFFFNVKQNLNYLERFQDPQVKLASEAGVHIYSLLLPGANYRGPAPDFSELDEILDSFVKADPQAVFILRIFPGPNPDWKEWPAIPESELMRFTTGSTKTISIASDYFWGLSNRGMADLIRHFEHGRFGNRILAYHIGGPEFEMFQYAYRESGPDICDANQLRFRKWLRAKYRTDSALRAAWGDPKVTLDTARVPEDRDRFPMRHAEDGELIHVFYDIPCEQNWIDFSDYYNNLAADRVIDWAELVRRETSGRKLSVFAYGYTFELPGSFAGHYALQRLLANPAIDILMSPISYYDRATGGPGGFMSPVDTVGAHGKLWLNEDDIRTHVIDRRNVPHWLGDAGFGIQAKDLHDSINLLERNFSMLLCHRSATWWMDLAGAGAFSEPALWQVLKDCMPLYQAVYRQPRPYRPEVAMIVDERSKLFVKSDWDANYRTLANFSNQCARSGAAVGYYTLVDFISGVVPRCKAYVFANAFFLTPEQAKAINRRLDREKSTAIWIYAPGYVGPKGFDVAASSSVTGIRLAVRDGKQGSKGLGMLKGLEWAPDLVLSPRLVVDDVGAHSLGRYASDGCTSSAMKRVGRHHSIFLGDMGIPAPVLTRLFELAGVHIWTDDQSIVQTDGDILAIHSGKGGPKPIHLPKEVSAEPIKGSISKRKGDTIFVEFQPGDTLWFRLVSAR